MNVDGNGGVSVEEMLKQILGELRHVNQRLDSIDTRLEKVEHRLDNVERRMDNVEQRLDRLEQRMDHFEQRVDTLEAGQKELHHMVSAIRDNQLEGRAAIDVMQHHVANMQGDIKSIKSSTVTKLDLQFYDAKIGEHEREIFKMKQQ
jgi:chromosome segregation ATPase